MRRHSRATTFLATVCALLLAIAACAESTGGAPTTAGGPTRAQIAAVAPTALIIDASGSMTENDAPGPRIDAAKAATRELVRALPADAKFALLTYGTATGGTEPEKAAGCRDITIPIPLGVLDRDKATAAVDGIVPRGFTPIADSLRRAADQLPTSGKVAIVLVSDGEDTCDQPPCPVAQQLKQQRPELQISTIGFRTDTTASDQLRCIANATGGMFVTAANSAQLTARLIATQDQSASTSLIGGTLRGVAIGDSLTDIRKRNAEFPAAGKRDGNRTIIVWRDCDWVFGSDGSLAEIRPHGDAARTVDGIGPGSTVGDARRFYGDPVTDGPKAGTDGGRSSGRTVVFPTGEGQAGYSMDVDGAGDSGRITSLIVCLCVPKGAVTSTEQVTIRPFTRHGGTTAGWIKDRSKIGSTGFYGCKAGPVNGVTDDGMMLCTGPSGTNTGICSPAVGETFLLCVLDPWSKTITLMAPEGTSLPANPRAVDPRTPYGLVLQDGTRCTLAGARGVAPDNSTVPGQAAPYSCGRAGDVYAPVGAFPADRSTKVWRVTFGQPGSTPVRTVAVTQAVFVGYGQ
ncbi:VWA domain-containing protein [Tsukamurella sp. NPDC003166]|uniref:vWA domain-containing protein n=1 Tax=Tsukamurella sp. NPDC003166 TaxID=3154444 RepID=UPI0033AEA1D7